MRFFSNDTLENQVCRPKSGINLYPGGAPMPGRSFNSNSYEYGFNGMSKVDEISGSGNHYTAEFWEYDPRTVRRWNTDPVVKEWESPYAAFRGNPIWFVDPNGDDPSTHTDEDGAVVSVKDDGDNGVYKHAGKGNEALNSVNKNYSKTKTSAGGTKMGESLHSLSFADQSLYNATGKVERADIKINFGSTTLTDKVQSIIGADPSLKEYAGKAATNGVWDIKSKVSDGSLLFGKYASPRDAGNFAAGAVAQKSSFTEIANFGYGAYNLTGNSKPKTGLLTYAITGLTLINPIAGAGTAYLIGKYGEDKLTQRSIDLGKDYIKNQSK
jgi:hypothetical protein